MKSRLKDNKELLAYLQAYIEAHPNLRFSQILSNFDFVKQDDLKWVDEYYTESETVLKRVKETYEKTNSKS